MTIETIKLKNCPFCNAPAEIKMQSDRAANPTGETIMGGSLRSHIEGNAKRIKTLGVARERNQRMRRPGRSFSCEPPPGPALLSCPA